MCALIVYESMFGNTRRVAEAIGSGLVDHGPVEVVEVGTAPTRFDGDLLVVGAPTHAFGLSRPSSRLQAGDMFDGTLVSAGAGVREWLDRLDTTAPVAVFSTRVRFPLGSAARAISRRLRSRGFTQLVPPEDFLVLSQDVPLDRALVPGEEERARLWGASLAQAAARRSSRAPLQ
jgi:hypothetical protein